MGAFEDGSRELLAASPAVSLIWVVGGLFKSLCEGAAARGLALIPGKTPTAYPPHGWFHGPLEAGIPFDPFGMAAYLDERVGEAGLELLLATQALDVVLSGPRITHVILSNKSGLAAVPAAAVVDATGDADIAARSGCEVAKGRDEDHLMAPASLTFHVSHVDQDALSEYIHREKAPRFEKLIEKLRAAGEWTFPYEIFISVQLQEKGTLMINTTRLVGVDGTDGASVSRGLMQGREEIRRLLALMRKHFSGFRDARLKSVAPALGVRETRRIRGPYVLTVEDLVSGKAFDDRIGFSAYGWDLPAPKRPSHNPGHGKKPEETPIPYRVMLPRPVTNLICPGRAISVERDVLGPLRVMAPCMAMGEAAGQAAATAAAKQLAFAEVNVKELQEALRGHGAVLQRDPPDRAMRRRPNRRRPTGRTSRTRRTGPMAGATEETMFGVPCGLILLLTAAAIALPVRPRTADEPFIGKTGPSERSAGDRLRGGAGLPSAPRSDKRFFWDVPIPSRRPLRPADGPQSREEFKGPIEEEGTVPPAADTIVVYPGPEGLHPSPLYRLIVNGRPSFVYPVTINPTGDYRNASAPAAMTYFDFEGTVTVEITTSGVVESASVHPLSRDIKTSVRGGTVRFTLTRPGNYAVLFNGSRDRPLFIFAGPPETEVPSPNAPGVVYFGPGVHSPGPIDLRSHQTLYIAGGAFVKGRLRSRDAENVRIQGRGILYGGDYRKEEVGGDKFVTFRNCRDVQIGGIVLLDAFGWNMMIAGSRNVTVDNVKIVSWRMNSDGIDPVSSEDVVIRNCFIKNHDDGISLKGSAEAGGRLRNITVTRCVMWQNWMRSFVLGGELTVKSTENIVFRDSDILYSGVNPKSAGHRDAALSVWNVDAGVARDVLFENIRVEEAARLVRLALFKNKFSRQSEWGQIEGVTFRHVTVRKGPAGIEIDGHSPDHLVRNVTFENLEIEGKLIRGPGNLASYRADPATTRDIRFLVTR